MILRVHNTDILISELKSFPDQEITFKPRGLWYGIDNEWIDWCKNEMPGWVKPRNYNLDLDMSRILCLKSEKDVIEFHRTYSISPYPGCEYTKHPDWRIITRRYGGIEINPYIWDIRLNFNMIWYAAWDCASGCIWDVSVIRSIKEIKI